MAASSSRMTPARKALELLSNANWMFGLAMVKQSNGLLKRATVYVHLLRLEKAGFVRSRYVDERTQGPFDSDVPRRREYQITSRGRAALLRDDL